MNEVVEWYVEKTKLYRALNVEIVPRVFHSQTITFRTKLDMEVCCIEIVVNSFQYDAKLLRLQKSNAKAQTAQSSNVNSDIFRKVGVL